MDDIKLFVKKEKGLEILKLTIRIYSQGIGMEFGIEKYAMLIMRSRKRQITEGIELPNKEKSEHLEKRKNYKYSRIMEVDTIKQVEAKEKKSNKEYLRQMRKLLKPSSAAGISLRE